MKNKTWVLIYFRFPVEQTEDASLAKKRTQLTPEAFELAKMNPKTKSKRSEERMKKLFTWEKHLRHIEKQISRK